MTEEGLGEELWWPGLRAVPPRGRARLELASRGRGGAEALVRMATWD